MKGVELIPGRVVKEDAAVFHFEKLLKLDIQCPMNTLEGSLFADNTKKLDGFIAICHLTLYISHEDETFKSQ